MRLEDLAAADDGGLLDAGSPRGTVAWTPLQYACALGDDALVAELLAKSADASVLFDCGRTKFGYAPLHVATRFGQRHVVDQLLAKAAECRLSQPVDDAIGASALHIAVVQGDAPLVRRLLDASDSVPTTKNGTTPYELAKRLGHSEISQLLLDHEKRTRSKELLGDWLASIGMIEYAPHLHAAGFDDARFLLLHGLSDATLDAMKIDKPGHRVKLQSLYQLKEFLQVEDPRDDGSDSDSGDDSDEDQSEGDPDDSDVPLHSDDDDDNENDED
ncbi:hypothetical protein P43SY_001374 [Pythium insidiosum]|uniref:SAM domain-containing protein n=1 Tax=Pythium insidiosum TaxID=114742 RepID=A0AAD5Q8W5_PYTIN|nr:hypothetical protein P43SY_001374 [Pythium insidiosum]